MATSVIITEDYTTPTGSIGNAVNIKVYKQKLSNPHSVDASCSDILLSIERTHTKKFFLSGRETILKTTLNEKFTKNNKGH